MSNSVRYYIVKSDDQPVVRSIAVSRPQPRLDPPIGSQPRIEVEARGRKPRVSALLRHALRRKDDERA
jgi:hypothetical protein